MTIDYIEELLRVLDPATSGTLEETQSREDEIWQAIVASLDENALLRPRHVSRVRHTRRFWGVGALSASVVTAATLLVAVGGVPTSAVAATMKAAAKADAHAAMLPTLSAGQYYYQESQVSLVCKFAGTNTPAGEPSLTYIANGTMQSWTATDGSGRVVITPSVIGGDGSHFATPTDEARWVALGKPFIPCALGNASNQIVGNPANADTTSPLGGYATTISGYGGFGISLASGSQTSLMSASTSINNLPQSATAISMLLANGQINTDGSLSSSPQTCPVIEGAGGSGTGCTPDEQLAILEQLLQLPDASAKLGSVLYQVVAGLPGATLAGTVAVGNGALGNVIQVAAGGGDQTFEVVLNSHTGSLISCSELVTSNGVTSSVGSISYGAVQVVQGQGATPTTANNS